MVGADDGVDAFTEGSRCRARLFFLSHPTPLVFLFLPFFLFWLSMLAAGENSLSSVAYDASILSIEAM